MAVRHVEVVQRHVAVTVPEVLARRVVVAEVLLVLNGAERPLWSVPPPGAQLAAASKKVPTPSVLTTCIALSAGCIALSHRWVVLLQVVLLSQPHVSVEFL